MTERKYSVGTIGLRIDGFLQTTLENAGIEVDYEIQDASPGADDFETPDVSVKFACRKGLAKRCVANELRTGHYDELVISRPLLGSRCRSKLERAYPELRIELIDPAPVLLPQAA